MKPAKNVTLTISDSRFLAAASLYVTKNNIRYYLDGINITETPEGVVMQATDGRSLISIIDKKAEIKGSFNDGGILLKPQDFQKWPILGNVNKDRTAIIQMKEGFGTLDICSKENKEQSFFTSKLEEIVIVRNGKEKGVGYPRLGVGFGDLAKSVKNSSGQSKWTAIQNKYLTQFAKVSKLFDNSFFYVFPQGPMVSYLDENVWVMIMNTSLDQSAIISSGDIPNWLV